jgi:hypothetical protein
MSIYLIAAGITHIRGRTLLQRSMGTGLLYWRGKFTWVKSYAEMPQVIATIEAERIPSSSFMPCGYTHDEQR